MAQRFDGDIDALAAGETHDLLDGVGRFDHDVGAEAFRHRDALRDRLDGDDRPGAIGPRPGRRAEADRTLGEDRDGIAGADDRTLNGGETGGHDVGDEQHLFVREGIGDFGQAGLRAIHKEEVALGAEEEVAGSVEGLADALIALLAAAADAATEEAAGSHAVAGFERCDACAHRFDNTNGFMAHGDATGYGHFIDDVHVAAADGAERGPNQRLTGAGSVRVGNLRHRDGVGAGLHTGVGGGHWATPRMVFGNVRSARTSLNGGSQAPVSKGSEGSAAHSESDAS